MHCDAVHLPAQWKVFSDGKEPDGFLVFGEERGETSGVGDVLKQGLFDAEPARKASQNALDVRGRSYNWAGDVHGVSNAA